MTPNVYLVWYREKTDTFDKAAGFAYSWSSAEKMAKDLFVIKRKIEKCHDVITGVSLLECGNIYTLDQPKQKWQVMPFLSVLRSER